MCLSLHSGFGLNQTAITATLQEGLHAFLRTVRALLAVFVGKEDAAFQISADIPSTCFIIIITDFEVRKLNKGASIFTFVLHFLPSLLCFILGRI